MKSGLSASDSWIGRCCVVIALSFFLFYPLLHLLPKFTQKNNFSDFGTVYYNAKSLWEGYNPYLRYEQQVQPAAVGGVRPRAQNSLMAQYPPWSLAYFVPLTILPFKGALAFWLCFCTGCFATAAFCILDLGKTHHSSATEVLLSVFIAGSVGLQMQAQPSTAAISFCVVALWAQMQRRSRWLVAFCLAISIVLKPQIGMLFLLYLLVSRKKDAVTGCLCGVLAALLSVPGLLLISVHPLARGWLNDLLTNVRTVGANGNINDPSPANSTSPSLVQMDTLFHAVFASHTAALVSGVMIGVVLLAWAAVLWSTKHSEPATLARVALTAAVSLLVFHHRSYDSGILLLVFPLTAFLLSRKPAMGYVCFGLMSCIVVLAHYPIPHLLHMQYAEVEQVGLVRYLIAFRMMQIFLLALTAFLFVATLRMRTPRKGANSLAEEPLIAL